MMSRSRYSNHSSQTVISKPVDYFLPLTVDVSVEYELPKEVAPPPGSAPLLIIHPSAYYRSPPQSKPENILSPRPSNNNRTSNTGSSLSSTYFLRSSSNSNNNVGATGVNGAGLPNNPSIFSSSNNHQNIGSRNGNSGSSKSVRYGNSGNGTSSIIMNSTSISRSRSMTMGAGDSRSHSHGGGESVSMNCPYGKCDECASGSGCGNTTATTTSSSRVTSNSNGVKKQGIQRPRQQSQQDGLEVSDPIEYYQLQQLQQLHNQSRNSSGNNNNINNSTSMQAENTSKTHLPPHVRQLIQQLQQNNSNNGIRYSSTGNASSANGMIDCGVGGSGNGTSGSSILSTSFSNHHRNLSTSNNASSSNIISNSNSSNFTSNKRLRMSQQQNNMQHQQHTVEPLNLAVLAPSAGASGNSYLQQQQIQQHLSPPPSFLDEKYTHYKEPYRQQNVHLQQQQNRTSAGIIESGIRSVNGYPYTNSIHQMINSYSVGGGYRSSHLSALSNLYNSSLDSSTAQSANRFLKECPILVDKGSGSDSGVCSENDSDVSPPMAPYHSNSNNLNSNTPNNSRRSILSQNLPSSGCYCCCCPTGDSIFSRSKSVGGKVKSSSGKSSRSGSGENSRSNNSNSSVSVTNYSGAGGGTGGIGSAYATMVIQESQLDNVYISCDSAMASRGSPMEFSSSPATYRKWLGVGNPGVEDPITNAPSFSLGKWFQV